MRFQEFSVSDLARRFAGGGGSIGYIPFSRPQILFSIAIGFVGSGLWDLGIAVTCFLLFYGFVCYEFGFVICGCVICL